MPGYLCRPLGLAMLLLLGLPGRYSWLAPAAGQPARPSAVKNKFHIPTEQLPELPTGGGVKALIAAVEQRLVLPAGTAVPARQSVEVRFAVSENGLVENPEISIGMGPVINAAVLSAVRQLPTLSPGTRNGQPVRMIVTLNVQPPAPPASPQEQREAQTRQQALAERRPGEADTTFLRRVLPVSFPQSNDLLAATWRPSAFGKQLFFSVRGADDNEYGTDLFMLDPFQANTYAVQVFAIAQADMTSLEAFFFADVNRDGRKELLAISRCDLRGGEVGNGFYPRTPHYQTHVFQCVGLSSTGRPQYRDYPTNTDYLNELPTAADVRAALAEHRRQLPPRRPAAAKAPLK